MRTGVRTNILMDFKMAIQVRFLNNTVLKVTTTNCNVKTTKSRSKVHRTNHWVELVGTNTRYCVVCKRPTHNSTRTQEATQTHTNTCLHQNRAHQHTPTHEHNEHTKAYSETSRYINTHTNTPKHRQRHLNTNTNRLTTTSDLKEDKRATSEQ